MSLPILQSLTAQLEMAASTMPGLLPKIPGTEAGISSS